MFARRWYPFYYSQIRRLYQHTSGQIHVAQASDGFETYLDRMPRSSRFCFKAGVGPNFATGLSDTRDRYYLWERTGTTGQVVPVRSRAVTCYIQRRPAIFRDGKSAIPNCGVVFGWAWHLNSNSLPSPVIASIQRPVWTSPAKRFNLKTSI